MLVQCYGKVNNLRCNNKSTSILCSICQTIEKGHIATTYKNMNERLIMCCDTTRVDDTYKNLESLIEVIDRILQLRSLLLGNYYLVNNDTANNYSLAFTFLHISNFIDALYKKWDSESYRYNNNCCKESQMIILYEKLKIISSDQYTQLTDIDYSNVRTMCSNLEVWNNLLNLIDTNEDTMKYIYNYVKNLDLAVNKIFDNIKLLTGGGSCNVKVNTSKRLTPLNPTNVIDITDQINRFSQPELGIYWYKLIAQIITKPGYYYLRASIKVINDKCIVIIEHYLPQESKILPIALGVRWLGNCYSYDLIDLETLSYCSI